MFAGARRHSPYLQRWVADDTMTGLKEADPLHTQVLLSTLAASKFQFHHTKIVAPRDLSAAQLARRAFQGPTIDHRPLHRLAAVDLTADGVDVVAVAVSLVEGLFAWARSLARLAGDIPPRDISSAYLAADALLYALAVQWVCRRYPPSCAVLAELAAHCRTLVHLLTKHQRLRHIAACVEVAHEMLDSWPSALSVDSDSTTKLTHLTELALVVLSIYHGDACVPRLTFEAMEQWPAADGTSSLRAVGWLKLREWFMRFPSETRSADPENTISSAARRVAKDVSARHDLQWAAGCVEAALRRDAQHQRSLQ